MQVNLGEMPHKSTLQQRLHKWKQKEVVAWRSPIVTALGPLPFARSINTRRAPNFWSGRHPSSVLWKRLHKTSSRICECRALPFLPSRRLWRHTLFVSLMTPMSVQSTESVWQWCRKTCSWRDASEERWGGGSEGKGVAGDEWGGGHRWREQQQQWWGQTNMCIRQWVPLSSL